MTVGLRAGFLGRRAAAAGGSSVTLSAFTVALDSGATGTANYNYSLTGLPAGTKAVILLIYGNGPNLTSRAVSSVSVDDGSSAVISATPAATSRFPIAAYAITGVTDTDVGGTVTFNGNMNGCWIGYLVITDTTATTYHSRSGAAPSAGTNAAAVTSAAITIPTGGVGIAFKGPGNSAFGHTWTVDAGSVTEDFDTATANNGRPSVAHAFTTATTTFTATHVTNTNHAILAFSWGP